MAENYDSNYEIIEAEPKSSNEDDSNFGLGLFCALGGLFAGITGQRWYTKKQLERAKAIAKAKRKAKKKKKKAKAKKAARKAKKAAKKAATAGTI